MKIERVDHVHVYVKELNKAREFFADLLGTRFSGTMGGEEVGFRSVVSPFGIELLEGTSPDSDVGKAVAKRGEGLAAISLKVDNIADAEEHFKKRGIRVLGRIDHKGLKEVWFHPMDTFGVMVELCEYDAEHPAYTVLTRGENK
jgi:methylmalonyl-CoA epimerase